ncbi:TetR family transcriptional regulator [Actinoplanes sp. OR16]|uniref:TetR/AcrR family transcriptional regulator n=1 Tax=Actinoplanes sp. OR16 TaxID=946334 RepID=UPI000F6E060F|nr:TetR/AcrR family transcriptional regulator C-terminal domain-containing protein [Actinoplanes sp. OR16]BBH71797.1 TetR family transcriptional regulator [Actinoplanes sp. OR16]
MVKTLRLNRDRVLRAAVDLADSIGLEQLSMRRLATELDVVPMALYKHVANKDELLDGMVDVVVGDIDPPAGPGADWKPAVRQRILSARRTMLRHPWASRAIEKRQAPTTVVLAYMNSVIGMLRAGGMSAALTHHAMHALGSRILGFTQELFTADSSAPPPDMTLFPHVLEMAVTAAHETGSVVGAGCDDQFEFEFALDLLLDGLERLHQQNWTPHH